MADSPRHYTRGSIEVWDFIRDQGLNYFRGNAIKYLCLKKAIHYLENELHHTTINLEKSQRSSNTIPLSVWDPEQHGEPDYATGFDR